MSTDDIKDIIKNRRIEMNLTLLDVAKAVGVSEGTVSRWETGDIADMKRSRIAALAKVLRISPNVIMGWKETDDYKSFGKLLKTNDENLINLLKSINDMSEVQISYLKEISDMIKDFDEEQRTKFKKFAIIVKSNII